MCLIFREKGSQTYCDFRNDSLNSWALGTKKEGGKLRSCKPCFILYLQQQDASEK